MLEFLILAIGMAVIVYMFTQTDIPEKIMHAFSPEQIKESARMAMMGIKPEEEEPSITSDEGGIRKELPITIPYLDVKIPSPQQAMVVDKSRPEYNLPVVNPELEGKAITDMPFLKEAISYTFKEEIKLPIRRELKIR